MGRTAIVGAGITGLVLTHALRTRGHDVVTFEQADLPGGVIRSERVSGKLLEYGPQRLRLAGPLERLVEELDLSDSLRHGPEDAPIYVLADGELGEVPRSLRAFLRTDLLSIRGKWRILGEPLTASGRPDETAGDLFRRKFGAEAYRNVIEPLLGGIYASDPARMPAEHAIAPVLALERQERSLLLAALKRLRGGGIEAPVISFDEGLATLPRALYGNHQDVVDLGTTVTAIEASAGGYHVVHHAGTTAVDRVVLTTPAGVTADLLADLPGASVGGLAELRYNSLALVHLSAGIDVNGFGYQVRRDDPGKTLGVTWNDPLFARDGVYTAFLGGMWDPGITDRGAEELGETARREFERTMSAQAEVLDVTVLERAIPAFDDSWHQLETVSLPDGLNLAANYTGRIGVTGRIRQAERVADAVADGSTGNAF